MQRFKSPFAGTDIFVDFGPIYKHFHPKKHLIQADKYRDQLSHRFDTLAALIA